MSERYHRITPRFWADTASWAEDARTLALYLLTGPHRKTEGLFRLPKAYIMGDLNWSPQRLDKAFRELLDRGFIEYDEDASVVLIRKALKFQAPENPNQVKSAIANLSELPETALLSQLLTLSERYCERLAKALREAFPERLGKPQAQAQALTQAQTQKGGAAEGATAEESIDPAPLCELLADLCAEIDPNGKRPTITKRWRDAERLLLERDGRDPKQAERLLRWVFREDCWWRGKVLSMPKFREKYTQLYNAAVKDARRAQQPASAGTTQGPEANDFSKYDQGIRRAA